MRGDDSVQQVQERPETGVYVYERENRQEVKSGQECGMLIDGYDDIKVGDVLECYKVHHVQPGA